MRRHQPFVTCVTKVTNERKNNLQLAHKLMSNKMTKKLTIFLGLAILSISLYSQTTPFNIYIEPMNISGLGGLQSFAYGQHNEKWLIVGGRLDGLHRRQPFAAFDIAGNNNQIIVIDPVSQQKWTSPITSLPVAMQEQLSFIKKEITYTLLVVMDTTTLQQQEKHLTT